MAKTTIKKKIARTKAGFLNSARDNKLSKDWGKAFEEAKKLANDNKPSSKTKPNVKSPRTPRGTPRGGGSFTAEVYDETMKVNKGTTAKGPRTPRGTPRGTSSSASSRSAASRFTAEVYDETMRVGKSRASQVGGALLRGGLRWAGPVGALVSMTEPAGEGSDKPSGPLMRGNADRGPQRPRYSPPSGPKNRQPLPKGKAVTTTGGTLTSPYGGTLTSPYGGTLTSPYEPRSKTAKSEGPGRMGSQTVTAPKRIGINAAPPGGPPLGARPSVAAKTRSSVGSPGAARAWEDKPSVAAATATAASAVNNKGATTPSRKDAWAWKKRRMAERYAIGTSGRPM